MRKTHTNGCGMQVTWTRTKWNIVFVYWRRTRILWTLPIRLYRHQYLVKNVLLWPCMWQHEHVTTLNGAGVEESAEASGCICWIGGLGAAEGSWCTSIRARMSSANNSVRLHWVSIWGSSLDLIFSMCAQSTIRWSTASGMINPGPLFFRWESPNFLIVWFSRNLLRASRSSKS